MTLAFPSADNGGSDVHLTSSTPAVLGVPSVVKVRGNSSTATFTVTTAAVSEPVAATLTATYGGVVQRAQIVVARENAVTLAGLSVTPDRVAGGTTATGRVTLAAPAPFGGALVAIAAKRRNIVNVPPSVMVPEGATSAVFPIGTEFVHGQKERSLELVVTYNNTTAAATLTVTPPPATATSQRPAALCASLALAPCLTQTALQIATSTSSVYDRQYNLYTPELSLLAETSASPNTAPPIAYEYIWFAGEPLAQVNVAANQIHYYFNDHLGTPILQTDATARIVWQVEYEPYGTVYAARRGEAKHQPLRFPGQESGVSGELSYNIYRWYQSEWGRYTQADPIGLAAGLNLYGYALANPNSLVDPLGAAPKFPQFPPSTTDDCSADEWKSCEGKCGSKPVVGCYVTITHKLKTVKGFPQFGIQRTVNCNCKEDDCEKSWPDKLKDWWKEFTDPSKPPLPPLIPIPPKLPTPKPVIPGLPPFFVNPCMLNPSLCYGDTGIA